MAELKDKVAGYLSSFLDKELSEIAVDTHKAFLDKRAEKEAERIRAASDVRAAAAKSISDKAAHAEKIKTAAEYQGGITKPEGGQDSATRHQLKRQAWKHKFAAQGPSADTGAKPAKGREGKHTGRVATAVSKALAASGSPGSSFSSLSSGDVKKKVIGQQTKSPEVGTSPNFTLANQFVSNRPAPKPLPDAPKRTPIETPKVAGRMVTLGAAPQAAQRAHDTGKEVDAGVLKVSDKVLADLRAGKSVAKSSETELQDLGKQMAAEKRPTPALERPAPTEYKKK